MDVIPQGFLDILTEKKALAHLATVQPDGSPQVTPVWFDYTNGLIRVNTAKHRIKGRNMAVGVKVALSIVAEIQAVMHRREGGSLKRQRRRIHD